MGLGGGARGIGGGFARVAAGSPEAEKVHPGSGPWILERREGETFHHIGVFGSFAEAMKALDEQVGLGHGTLLDYELELLPRKAISTRKLVTQVVAWVFPISLIVACLAIAAVNIRAVAIALGITALAGLGAWGFQAVRHRS